jgi:hypothetical protein
MAILPPATNTADDTRNYNLPLYGIRGQFSLTANVTLPYFVTLIDLKRITHELKTHEEVSPSLETVYTLLELFQRQIDIERVQKDIVNAYLKVPNKVKFFNSLTIVLLPKDSAGRICPKFEDYPKNNPPLLQDNEFDQFFGNEAFRKSVFGGVQFTSTETANLSRLRWDLNRVDAVAVDGQHRLKALKLWMEGKNNELTEIEKPTRIPIIILLLHEEAGFELPQVGTATGIKYIAREIFTDLNKNAKEVDPATQIILDDRSVESCCVRSMITESTCVDDDSLLPLSMLRWQEANYRFDQKHFLNSLVNIHLLIEDLLDLQKPSKPMEKNNVLEFIRKASSLLGTGQNRRLEYLNVSLEEYYITEFVDSEEDAAVAPFSSIPSQFLPGALAGFKERFAGWLLKLLREFRPYADVIAYARQNNLIAGEFSQYLSQPKSHQQELMIELRSRHGENWHQEVIGRHQKAIEAIKGLGDKTLGEQWAFKTIFQKALVRLAKELFVSVADSDRDRLGSIDDYIAFLDRLYIANVLRVLSPLPGNSHFLWTFIAVNYGNRKIKVSSTSEKQIQWLLTLWYYGTRIVAADGRRLKLDVDNEESISVKGILKMLGTKQAQQLWPNCKDYVDSLMSLFRREAVVIQPPSDGIEPTDEAKDLVAKARLQAVFQEGVSPLMEVGNE